MKRIRIFTHVACEPPGYLTTLLDQLGYAHEQVCLFDGKQVPDDLDDIAALVFMGGPGNVNEPPDWMEQEFELIRAADARGVPVLGVCLGAQLMTRALGGDVWPGDSLEVGFHQVRLLPEARSHHCFRDLPAVLPVFQWHAYNITPPAGVETLATSECTPCQAYALGPHLAIQFHLEMTDGIIRSLLEKYQGDLVDVSNCVQSGSEIREGLLQKCERTFAIADSLLGSWFKSVMAR